MEGSLVSAVAKTISLSRRISEIRRDGEFVLPALRRCEEVFEFAIEMS